jgi:hypothetical protein
MPAFAGMMGTIDGNLLSRSSRFIFSSQKAIKCSSPISVIRIRCETRAGATACPEGQAVFSSASGTKVGRMLRILTTTLILTGCAPAHQPTILLEGHPPRVYATPGYREHVGWYTASHLDAIVRVYARENGIKFEFERTHAQFWVPRERDCLARAEYSSGIGRPVLLARIGWDGYVIDHTLAIAIDDVDLPDEDAP